MSIGELELKPTPGEQEASIESRSQEAANAIINNYQEFISGVRSDFGVFLVEPGSIEDDYQMLHHTIKERVIAGLGLRQDADRPDVWSTSDGVTLYSKNLYAQYEEGNLIGIDYSTEPF